MLRALAISSLLLAAACGSKSNPAPTNGGSDVGSGSAPATACVVGGCSGTMCSEPGNEMVTTCEFKDEYACYRTAACERQPDGQCGWTQSDALKACLANPPKP